MLRALLRGGRGRWRRAGGRNRGIADSVSVSWAANLLHHGQALIGRWQWRKRSVWFRLIPVRD
jgi:hypothetical protein